MNRIVTSAVACMLCLPGLAAQTPAPAAPGAPSATPPAQSAPAASPAAPSATPHEESSPDYSQEAFVIEQYRNVVRFENDGTGERDLTVRARVQSDAGVQQLGELVFGYNSANEQMDVRYVRVRKADGTVVNAAPDAVKEMTPPVARDAPVYTDFKEKHITVPSLAPGDTLEYELATRLVTPFAPGEFWYQHDFLDSAIVLDETLEVNVPRGRTLNIESPAFPYKKEDEKDRTIYRWSHANLARPAADETPKKKSSASKPPDVQFTTFKGWDEVGRWYAKLEEGRAEPTPEIRAKTQALIEGRATDLEKIEALYDYVSKNIRYVGLSFGLGRYQPHSAAEVFTNQYGDCKDKHTLLAAMLAAAGLHADAVLIPSSRKLDTAMPSPLQFDHVITVVPEGKELLWMDTTAAVAPFRMLTSPLRDKAALLVLPDGAGKIVQTPADPPFLSTQDVKIEGQVSELGKLNAKLHYAMRGDTEFVLRSAFRATPQARWKDLGQTILTLDGLKGEVVSVNASDPADTRNSFEMDIEFTQANFLDWSGKKAKVDLPLVTIGLPEESEDNAEAIQLGSPLHISTELTLKLPAGFTAQPPVAIAVSRDYAEFKSTYDFADHTFTAGRVLDFKARELPADRTSDYLAFARAVHADQGQALLVENASSGAPVIPLGAKEDELLEAGLAALNSGNSTAALPLFQRVVELDPRHKQAWNDLGLAHLRLGHFDDAAAAFRKQIEVNPYDEHSYDYLGLTLEQQEKYDDAAAAFRQQIQLDPLDPVAHSALGGLLLSQHKYPAALPELEKATVLAPENAELEVSLGTAYMNTGDKEKALAAFEKAAEMAQTPAVWNNVAYSLADNKLELAKAQQYAESAVSATAADLRNIELPRLTLEDLSQVASIGAYWDTLGWVYFQKGDLDTAERYIRASWLLNEHGEVGDHLAQIYEKRGQKDQAIDMYALSLAAPHAVPETRARLMLLLGGNSKINALVSHAQPKFASLRAIPAGKLLNENAQADFLVLLAPGEKGAVAEEVKFIGGSEKLRPFAGRLRSLDFGAMFPDASPAKLVRRGTLSCSAGTGDCSFTLILPEDVHTIN